MTGDVTCGLCPYCNAQLYDPTEYDLHQHATVYGVTCGGCTRRLIRVEVGGDFGGWEHIGVLYVAPT